MNLAIHGIDNKGLGARWGDTFARDQHADMQMDYVLANPPFNIKNWTRNVEDPRWKYGVPRPTTQTMPGSSTSCRSSSRAVRPAW